MHHHWVYEDDSGSEVSGSEASDTGSNAAPPADSDETVDDTTWWDDQTVPMTAVLVDGPQNSANFALNDDGSFNYTADDSGASQDGFSYYVTDGYTQSSPAYATVSGWLPKINIDDNAILEPGPGGTTNLVFRVWLDQPATQTVRAYWNTQDGTAVSSGDDKDFTATGGQVTFNVGETETYISVQVLGKAAMEDDRSFQVKITGFDYAQAGNLVANGLIYDRNIQAVEDDYDLPESDDPDTPPTLDVSVSDGVLSDDRFIAANYWDVELVDGPQHGTVTLNEDGSFKYTQTDTDYQGDDSFTYLAYRNPPTGGSGDDGQQQPQQVGKVNIKQQSDAKLTSVSFGREDGAYTSRVYNDNSSPEDRRWVDNNGNGTDDPGDTHGTLVYTLGATIYAAPTFEITLQGVAPDQIAVQGNAVATSRWGEDFTAEFSGVLKKQPGSVGNTYTYSLTPGVDTLLAATAPLPQTADIYDHFVVSWQYSLNNTNWSQSYVSDNQVYVARTDDVNDIAQVWHTALDLGTAAHGYTIGANSDISIANALLTEFSSLEVYGYTSKQLLQYYGDLDTGAVNIADLLKTSDGQCDAWSQLFGVALYYENVASDEIEADVQDPVEGLVINDWGFSNTPSQPNDPNGYTYRYVMQPGSNFYQPTFVAGDGVGDRPGVEAQGEVANPPPLFGQHSIVKVIGPDKSVRYFDPSYGKAYDSFSDFEQKAVAGTWIMEEQSFSAKDLGIGDSTEKQEYRVLYIRRTQDVPALVENNKGAFDSGF